MKIDLPTLRTTALHVHQLNELTTPALVKLRRALIEHWRYLRLGVKDRMEGTQIGERLARRDGTVYIARARGTTRKTLHALRASIRMLAANRRLVNSVLRQRAAETRRAHAAHLAEKAARRLEAPKQRRRMNIERILRRRAELMARVKRERSMGRQYSMCLVLAQREKAKVLSCFDRVLYERLLAHAEVLRPRVRGAREGWATLPAEYAAAPDLVDVVDDPLWAAATAKLRKYPT